MKIQKNKVCRVRRESPTAILYAALLAGSASVVRDSRNVADDRNLQPGTRDGADCSFTTATWAFYLDHDGFHSVVHSGFGSVLCGDLRGERRTLTRALEADLAGAGPRYRVPYHVGNRHDRVVEG